MEKNEDDLHDILFRFALWLQNENKTRIIINSETQIDLMCQEWLNKETSDKRSVATTETTK